MRQAALPSHLVRRATPLTERFASDAGSSVAEHALQLHRGDGYLMAYFIEAMPEGGLPRAIPSAPRGEEGRL